MQKPDQESQQDIPVKIKHDLLWHGKRQETDDIPPCKGFGLFGDHGQPAIGAFELEIVFDFHNDSEREFLSAMWACECFLGIHTWFLVWIKPMALDLYLASEWHLTSPDWFNGPICYNNHQTYILNVCLYILYKRI